MFVFNFTINPNTNILQRGLIREGNTKVSHNVIETKKLPLFPSNLVWGEICHPMIEYITRETLAPEDLQKNATCP